MTNYNIAMPRSNILLVFIEKEMYKIDMSPPGGGGGGGGWGHNVSILILHIYKLLTVVYFTIAGHISISYTMYLILLLGS